MKLINKFLYPILIMSAYLLILSVGCEKNDDDENENENGNIDHEITYGSVTDIDGNIYKTVDIGDQKWMAENLRVSRFNNGDSLAGYLNNSEWDSTQIGAYAYWDKDSAMLEAYGMFYNWYAVNDSRNICPSGWHVPSDYEWNQLSDYLINNYDVITSKNVGNYLKSCRQEGSPLGDSCDTQEHPRWTGDNTHYGRDVFGFSALPAGKREDYGDYVAVGRGAFFWSANEISNNEAIAFGFLHNDGDLQMGGDVYSTGFCIRCIKD